MRWVPLCLALVFACARKAPSIPPPPKEPTIRVHLRSLGGTWTALRVAGKRGQVLHLAGARDDSAEPVLLRRAETEDGIRIEGVDGVQKSFRLVPKGGVFTVGDQTYAGELEWREGKLINRVLLENYVLGVLRGELPLPKVPAAAAEAQAIAARSYALHYLDQNRRVFDLDDTTLYQRYVGLRYAPDDAHLRQGVQRTRGLFLRHEGAPLKAYYHSTCGGHTADVPTGLDRETVECMAGVPCDHCAKSKYYRWEALVTDAEIREALGIDGSGPLALEVVEAGPGGRARTLSLQGPRGAVRTLHAGEFRLMLGASRLRSTLFFRIERVEGGFALKGGGWGHGVGLCQMGAVGQGGKGLSGEQIVQYYYPGATIRRAY